MGHERDKGGHLGGVSFSIPHLPVSCNSIYQVNHRQRRVYLHPDAQLFKTRAKQFIPRIKLNLDDAKIWLKIAVHSNWYFKNGKFRRFDVQNLGKIVIDSVAESQGFKDEGIWCFEAVKVQDLGWQGVKVELGVIDGD